MVTECPGAIRSRVFDGIRWNTVTTHQHAIGVPMDGTAPFHTCHAPSPEAVVEHCQALRDLVPDPLVITTQVGSHRVATHASDGGGSHVRETFNGRTEERYVEALPYDAHEEALPVLRPGVWLREIPCAGIALTTIEWSARSTVELEWHVIVDDENRMCLATSVIPGSHVCDLPHDVAREAFLAVAGALETAVPEQGAIPGGLDRITTVLVATGPDEVKIESTTLGTVLTAPEADSFAELIGQSAARSPLHAHVHAIRATADLLAARARSAHQS